MKRLDLRLKLQGKYSLAIFALVTLVVLVLATTLMVRFQQSMVSMTTTMSEILNAGIMEQLRHREEILVRSTAEHLADPVYQYDFAAIDEIVKAVRKQRDVVYVRVYESDGLVVHDGTMENARANTIPKDPVTLKAVAAEELLFLESENPLLLEAACPIFLKNGQRVGVVAIGLSLIAVEKNITSMEERLKEVGKETTRASVWIALAVAVVAIGASLIVAMAITRRLVNPIRLLATATERLERGELDLGVAAARRDELGELATAFVMMQEGMLDKMRSNQELQALNLSLDHANRTKSEFLANMSHEIRTPISAIMGLSDLALSSDELHPRTRDYLVKIANASHSLLRIINDILDFSKIEAGKLEIEQVDFHMRDVFDHVVDLFRAKATSQGVELIVSPAATCGFVLVGDYLRLEQILMNLISNALKFTETGEVEIGVEINSESLERVVLTFSVRDTGIGISPEQADKLFAAFVQADGSTTRKFGGTGLGLAISKRLTELMGGRIWVESQPNQGSIFRFTLPFQRSAQEEGKYLIPPADLRGGRVLVVDDNPATCKALGDMLTFFGFAVTGVGSGAAALEQVNQKEDPYALALVDGLMPTLNGLETARQIRGKGLDSLKIILMTGCNRGQEITQQVSHGVVNALLDKPINCSILFDTIMEVFGKEVAKAYRLDHQEADYACVLQHITGARVLLVEDNAINQQVAQEVLEKIGLVVTIANHGAEAIQMLAATDFDVVLMDVQMPVMDGYTATQRIRQNPLFAKLPVIAMTANALTGDREKSLASGMNDHVSKPIDKKQLFEALLRWIPPTKKVAPPPGNTLLKVYDPVLPILPGIDVTATLERLGGNEKLFRDLLLEFKRDFGDMGENIGVALAGEQEEARRGALSDIHAIKGVAGNLGAHDLFKITGELECGVRSGSRQQWQPLLGRFYQNLTQVMASIALLAGEEASPPCGEVTAQMLLSQQKVRLLMVEMSDLLLRADVSTEECLARLRQVLDASGGHPALPKLSEQVHQYDFNGAMATLTAMAATLNVALGE